MTRDELIEAMAFAMRECIITDDEGEFPRLFDLLDFSGENKAHTVVNGITRAALSAIEAAGFAIVPVVASEGMRKAGADVCEGWVYVDEAVAIYRAMIAAAQEELK